MDQTPVKTPHVTLTSVHQLSVEKSKAILEKTQNFVESNFKTSGQSPEQKMIQSSQSLSDTKAFFESELQLVLKMVQQSSKLYKEKENENLELTKKVKEYEAMIVKLKKVIAEQTANKSKKKVTSSNDNDESKTRKKAPSSEVGQKNSHVSTPSEFTVCQSKQMEKSEIQKNKKRQLNQCESSKNINQSQQQNQWCSQIEQLTCELVITKEKYENLLQELDLVKSQKEKLENKRSTLEKEYGGLSSKHSFLQQRYKQLEDKHGKSVAEYEISIQNLKSLIKGIQQHNSPQKVSEKDNEGYYSINRPLNKSQSQESFESQKPTRDFALSHAESNLREENQYLRNKLIQVLDDKGRIQIKFNKYKKLAAKFEAEIKEIKQKNSKYSIESVQNSQAFSNLDKTQKGQTSAQNFKKNKNSSVLVVQNTENKEKQILEELKIKNLVKKIGFHVINKNKIQVELGFQSKSTQIHFFENILQAVETYRGKITQLESLLSQIKIQNQNLKKETHQIGQNLVQDMSVLRDILKESGGSSNFSRSRDSTDSRFNKIKLIFEQTEQKIDEIETIGQVMTNSQLLKSLQKQKSLLNCQIVGLKTKICEMQATIERLYRENWTYRLEKDEHIKNKEKQSQMIIYSPSKQTPSNIKTLENSPFSLFKQKLTEFYQHTIKELDDWTQEARKTFHSPNRKSPEIQNQGFYSTPQLSIPQIVGRNIMKMSQEMKSIQNSSFDQQSTQKNEEYANVLFKEQKLSKSFIKQVSEDSDDNLQDVVNKKFEDLQQFSSNWIQKLISKDFEKKNQREESLKIPDLTLKQVARQRHEMVLIKAAKTDRSAVDKKYPFECDLEEIDCMSEEMSESQIMSERRIFIQEKVSYFIQNNEQIGGLLQRCKSKSSFGSFNG